jgi:hypothetical protein
VPRHTVESLKLGQPVRLLTGHEEPDKLPPADGRIVYIAVQAQPETGNFMVKARFDNKGLKLRANTAVQLQVQTTPEAKHLVVKDVALLEDTEPPTVVIVEKIENKEKKNEKGEAEKVEKIGTARRLQATVGLRDVARHLVEISKLVDPESKKEVPVAGTHVIVKGAHGLETGDKVNVEEEKKEEEKKESK